MIAVRAGADTHHAVNAEILQKLGKDGYVVNISRGSVIDQPALVAALTDKTIAGAGLDVFDKEPHAPDALTALPNVVLTPHVGGHTLESHVGDAGLRDRQSRGVFRRKTARLSGKLNISADAQCWLKRARDAACRDCARYRSRRSGRRRSPC